MRYIFLAAKNLLSAGLSIASVALAAFACIGTRQASRGRNYSDVGVPMYENDSIATLIGLLVFSILLLGLLFILQRTLSRDLQWLPYLAAAMTCICFAPGLFIALVW